MIVVTRHTIPFFFSLKKKSLLCTKVYVIMNFELFQKYVKNHQERSRLEEESKTRISDTIERKGGDSTVGKSHRPEAPKLKIVPRPKGNKRRGSSTSTRGMASGDLSDSWKEHRRWKKSQMRKMSRKWEKNRKRSGNIDISRCKIDELYRNIMDSSGNEEYQIRSNVIDDRIIRKMLSRIEALPTVEKVRNKYPELANEYKEVLEKYKAAYSRTIPYDHLSHFGEFDIETESGVKVTSPVQIEKIISNLNLATSFDIEEWKLAFETKSKEKRRRRGNQSGVVSYPKVHPDEMKVICPQNKTLGKYPRAMYSERNTRRGVQIEKWKNISRRAVREMIKDPKYESVREKIDRCVESLRDNFITPTNASPELINFCANSPTLKEKISESLRRMLENWAIKGSSNEIKDKELKNFKKRVRYHLIRCLNNKDEFSEGYVEV